MKVVKKFKVVLNGTGLTRWLHVEQEDATYFYGHIRLLNRAVEFAWDGESEGFYRASESAPWKSTKLRIAP